MHKKQLIFCLGVTAVLSLGIVMSGCVASENTVHAAAAPTETPPASDILDTGTDAGSNTQKVLPFSVDSDGDALARGEYYWYQDASRSNDIKVTVRKNSGKFTNSFSYVDSSTERERKFTPDEGKTYFYVFVVYKHDGHRRDTDITEITTPAVAAHRLIDKDNNFYRPIYVSMWNSVDSISGGKYYQPTTLGRLEDMLGYLIYEVPKDFTPEGAYLSIKLGKWGTPKWRLWD